MLSSGMLRRATLVITDVSEERRFLQEPHDVTSQKMTFFSHRRDNLKSYIAVGWLL
jgi:hypothetical protein